jgi:heme A synthase
MQVPVDLAATHQAGSLVLLSTALWLLRTVRI